MKAIRLGNGWKFGAWRDINDLAHDSFTALQISWKLSRYFQLTFFGFTFFFWRFKAVWEAERK